jgi:hypothetical protein
MMFIGKTSEFDRAIATARRHLRHRHTAHNGAHAVAAPLKAATTAMTSTSLRVRCAS